MGLFFELPGQLESLITTLRAGVAHQVHGVGAKRSPTGYKFVYDRATCATVVIE